ncbi:MAG: choice-of-anchor L domain-containing protein [Bacteroidales bacterium]|nr:choice-of-anchor L domain-containing protein [Bacteroidales bacterium]
MNFRIAYGLLIFLEIIPCLSLQAQLDVIPGSSISMTPTVFVQTYLVGQGITISNATFNGSSDPMNTSTLPPLIKDQIGNFVAMGGALSELNLAGGVILSTGKVQNAKNGGSTSTCTGGDSDPDLVILANQPGSTSISINDKSVLEFDFIPETDNVQFRYVFSSSEFDGYCPSLTCTGGFNDAFGLFLSGPGITGGSGFVNDAENIALLPGGAEYVTICNICKVDKGNQTMSGVYSWWNSKKDFFSQNRFTYVFTASHSVTCGQTYHMKFAIGDAGDCFYDSDVFLEQNSFSSNNFTPNPDFSNPETGDLLIPGCSSTNLIYTISQAKTTDMIIDLEIHPSGTAVQADILPNPFPNHATITAGQTLSNPIHIEALPKTVPEPDKTLVIKASSTLCSTVNSNFTTFVIKYNPSLSATLSPQTICSGNSATLTPVVSGGQQFVPSNVYHYLWSNGSTTPSITVSPDPGYHSYSVTVTDACGQIFTTNTTVDVGAIPATPETITGDNDICYPANGITYSIAPLSSADSYIWTFPQGSIIIGPDNGSTITVNFDQTSISGDVTVKGHNNICGDGPIVALPVTLRSNVVVSYTANHLTKTTKNGRSVLLKGGTPLGGVYSASAGISETSPGSGMYIFSPADPLVTSGNNYTIHYAYTNSEGCTDEKTQVITVFPSNATSPCPGWVTDVRDNNRRYSTFLSGSGSASRCWMSENLNYGDFIVKSQLQTDNGTPEKYCQNDQLSQCESYGGYYQWDELMEYSEIAGVQDICPPGWHVPTEVEWQDLITDISPFGTALAGGYLKETGPSGSFFGKTSGILYLNNHWSFTSDPISGVMFWTSTNNSLHSALAHGLNQATNSVSSYESSKANAFPVRCIRN